MGGNSENLPIELYDGIQINMNTNAKAMFKEIDDFMSNIQTAMTDPDILNAGSTSGTAIGDQLSKLAKITDHVLNVRAEVGAKENRVDSMMDRLSSQKLTVTKAMSNNEDVEYEATITQLITEESIHRAALSVGAKILQPTLVDFL